MERYQNISLNQQGSGDQVVYKRRYEIGSQNHGRLSKIPPLLIVKVRFAIKQKLTLKNKSEETISSPDTVKNITYSRAKKSTYYLLLLLP